MNTLFSLISSVTWSFWVSKLAKLGKFTIEHVLNATIAGGVMIGASANLHSLIYPSFLIGAFAGIWSTLWFNFFMPLYPKWRLYDIRGVQHLHGTVGILGGIASSITLTLFKLNYS